MESLSFSSPSPSSSPSPFISLSTCPDEPMYIFLHKVAAKSQVMQSIVPVNQVPQSVLFKLLLHVSWKKANCGVWDKWLFWQFQISQAAAKSQIKCHLSISGLHCGTNLNSTLDTLLSIALNYCRDLELALTGRLLDVLQINQWHFVTAVVMPNK